MFSHYLAGSILAFIVANTLAAGVKFAGVNIAGADFGCVIDGTCPISKVYPPLSPNGDGSGAGPGQMIHFSTVDKLNIFRLPVAWQYLVNNQLGGSLDATNFGQYDQLVQACLKTGAHCIIDIHNYARWNGNIIGQPGGPTNQDFSSLWSQLATKYASDTNVVMGLMNEPHDMPSITGWAASCQAAVTAIRNAGATSQMILLPGNGYTGASQFVSGGSAAALATVANPDGSINNLIFDIHQYLDSDGSGTTSSCTKNGISEAFQPLLSYLQGANRQALLSETGGGSSDPTCLTNLCEAFDFLNENSAYFLGWVGWAAGSFSTSYVLSLTPSGDTDVPLMTKCFAGKFGGGIGNSPAPSGVPSSAGPSPSASSDSASSAPPAGSDAPASSAPTPVSSTQWISTPPTAKTVSISATSSLPPSSNAPVPVESVSSAVSSPPATSSPSSAAAFSQPPQAAPSSGFVSSPGSGQGSGQSAGQWSDQGAGQGIGPPSSNNSTGPATSGDWQNSGPQTPQYEHAQNPQNYPSSSSPCKPHYSAPASTSQRRRRVKPRKARLAYEV